jgi:S1-C subfamily serine protease
MNDDPAQGAPQDAGPDPLDDTQRVDVPRYAPTPDPRPDARWAWASPGGQPTSERWYEPAPAEGQPAYAPPSWGQPAAADAPTPPPSAYGMPPTAVQPRRRGGAGVGAVVAASLLSAVLASGGTVFVLERTGAFDQGAPASSVGSGQTTGGQQPVTINESSAVIDAAGRVGPAVVKITTQGASTDPFTQIPNSGVGSGFIYDANGWILTNRHVVSDAQKLTVELKDGRQFEGTVYGIDTLTDLAIVKVDATGLPVAALGKSDGLKIGQLVVAIGSPLGTYSFSVTSGIVSGKGRDIAVDNGTRINNLIQTDAAINPGNSGGPLADATGAVVGINTAVATDSSGIGFAIPIDIAKPIMAQAVAGQALTRPWIGIRFQSINLKVKKDLNLSVDAGALVTNTGGTGPAIVDGSPAAVAGLKDGDIIIAINGTKIDGEHPLDAVLTQFKPEDTVSLDVLRGGATVQLSVTLGTRPGNL